MNMKRLRGPAPSGTGVHRNAEASLVSRKTELVFRRAAGKGLEPVPFSVCNPHSESEETLHNHLLAVEGGLTAVAAATNGYNFVAGIMDKSRQNAINLIGGFNGAGNAAMAAHWNAAQKAVALVACANGSQYAELIRANPTSDEGVLSMGGRELSRHVELQFDLAWAHVKKGMRLKEYAYTLEVPCKGDVEVFHLDLDAFSRVLRHPGMVLSCHRSISRPRNIDPDSTGFIADEIRKLENRETPFFRYLPAGFRVGDGGLAETSTPFDVSLATQGVGQRNRGSYVEIKLGVDSTDALKLLPFVYDHDNVRGTRKGFAEVFSGRFGMRGFNTFLGKARANSMLTLMASAMHDVAATLAQEGVLPLDGSYLQYWVDLPPTGPSRTIIERAISKRLHSVTSDQNHINLPFRPVLVMLDASQTKLADVKARFILDSMGNVSDHSPDVIGKTDFILNFLENVHPRVQSWIYDRMARKENGGTPLRRSDLEHIQDIRYICSAKRTIRNIEDLVWTLRMDGTLPDSIRARKTEIESWLFEFANARFESIFRLLAQRVRDEMGYRSG